LWIDVSALAGRPTLCGFATSDQVARVETMNEDELCNLAFELLDKAGVLPDRPLRAGLSSRSDRPLARETTLPR
jgi:hypothetical protein